MPSIKNLKAFNFQGWIEENKEKFKPPVGNAQVWEDGEMMVTVVGGPNQRRDYHDDPTEEFFYQLKGNIFLRIMENPGKPPLEIPIKQGEIFLLPKHMRHSPQRPADSIGVVVEMPRPEGALDGFEWYCQNCHQLAASSRGETEKHCARLAAVVREVLQQRESAQMQKLWRGSPRQTVKMPVIDIHNHFFPRTWPDLAARYGTPNWPWIKHTEAGQGGDHRG